MDGLKSKLHDTDFIQYLNGFDKFGLVETWEMDLNNTLRSLFPQFSVYFREA